MTTSAPRVMTGRMRHRAELQKKESVSDGAGGWETAWTKDRRIWCWIVPTSGVQRLESMRRDSQVSHEIYTRFASDVTTNKRIVYRGKAYNLEAIWSPDERQEFLHIVATEGVAT